MTIKAFAEKYGFDYNTVYRASYLVKSDSSCCKNRDYNEKDLMTAVKTVAQERCEHYRNKMKKSAVTFYAATAYLTKM